MVLLWKDMLIQSVEEDHGSFQHQNYKTQQAQCHNLLLSYERIAKVKCNSGWIFSLPRYRVYFTTTPTEHPISCVNTCKRLTIFYLLTSHVLQHRIHRKRYPARPRTCQRPREMVRWMVRTQKSLIPRVKKPKERLVETVIQETGVLI